MATFVCRMSSLFYVILMIVMVTRGKGVDNKTVTRDIHMAVLGDFSGMFKARPWLANVADMAIQDINSHPDILPGFTMKHHFVDTWVSFYW